MRLLDASVDAEPNKRIALATFFSIELALRKNSAHNGIMAYTETFLYPGVKRRQALTCSC